MNPRRFSSKPLKLWPDAIYEEKIKRFVLAKGEEERWVPGDRLKLFFFATLVIFAIFFFRLFGLSIISGDKNRELAENNRIKLLLTEPARGMIFDRNGKILARSQKVYVLKKDDKSVEISRETADQLKREKLADENFEGTLGQIYLEERRIYPLGEATSHVLGYLTQAANEDLEEHPKLNNQSNVGRLGVEASFENFLEGTYGKELVEVDAGGKNISILGKVSDVRGRDIHLAIDSDLQQVAYNALKKQTERIGTKRGAIVVSDPNSGQILALSSIPSFDPNDIGKYVTDSNKPFFDRAIQGTYPPGSIFKIVTALAGLESGKITADTEIEDVGEFSIGDTKFANWYFLEYGGRDGNLKVERAIARSNDIFFFRVAQKLGLVTLRQMAIKLGFGQKTGIDLEDEAFGLVPDEVWKKSTFDTPWYEGDTLHMGIGQGFMLVTPMQINSLISLVATGKFYKPYVVYQIDGDRQIKIEPRVKAEKIVSDKNLGLVREGMRGACKTGGTGWPFFDAPYSVGCKTGTAEKSQGNPHAWFSVFAPYDAPKVVVTVVIEDGGEGSSVAAPVAREVLDWYFKNRK